MTPVRRKPFRLLAAALLAAALTVSLGPGAAYAEPTPAEIAKQIDEQAEKLEKVIEDYNKVGEQLKVTRAKAAQLNEQLKPMQDKVDAARQRIGIVAANAYKGGNISSTSAMLAASSPKVMVEQLTMLDQFAAGQRRDIEAYTKLKAQYDGEKSKLDLVLGEQTKQEQDLAAQKTKIQEDIKKLEEQKKKAGVTNPPQPPAPPAPHLPGPAGKAVDFAYGVIGKPYIFGAEGPNGYDCSGLTLAAWHAGGASLPHNAAMQYSQTSRIGRGDLMPGDLVFSNGLGHVAIYIGNDQVIHAPQPGQNVKIASITQIGGLYGYGRVRI
ncbi:C40 family peptidase [Longispora albida]|uniref:C40 family peptidase n=1 Tax=Longispora albida TaxID=203523 RepID=UPI0003611CF9|nr:C40 family peptidase [Longispora albida]